MKSSKMSKGRNASKKVGNHCFNETISMLFVQHKQASTCPATRKFFVKYIHYKYIGYKFNIYICIYILNL